MQNSAMARPEQILAKGAERGLPIEPFGPIWDCARLRLARSSWSDSGLAPFLTSSVPYGATSSGRLSEDAVEMFLATVPDQGELRILELGAGSGLFAKLFLDRLQELAPEVYARTVYLATDGSATILSEQVVHGVLAAHGDRIKTRIIDVTGDWGMDAGFDAILGTYLLDSLPFDLLAVRDGLVWRKEVRSVLDDADAGLAQALGQALESGQAERLAEWASIGPRLGLQTRHVSLERGQLPYEQSLPRDTGGQTIPFVHCHGALACLDACRSHLRPGGVAIFSDYGHLAHLFRYDFHEFQAFGETIAIGLNFPQVSTVVNGWGDVVLHHPVKEEGNLYTRVLRRSATADTGVQARVDALYGAARHQALNAPLEKAREMLKSRFFESARSQYRQALAAQPRNWVIMEEVASGLLTMIREYKAAIEMADQGLARNPLAPGLWLVKAEANLALGDPVAARKAVERLLELTPTLAPSWRVLAELECDAGNHCATLDAVAAGLKQDLDGEEQDELLQIQSRALAGIIAREHQNLMARANQFRALDGLPE